MKTYRIERGAQRVAPTRESGFSFLEVSIASIMLLMLAWLVSTLTIDGMKATKFAERSARVTEIAQDVVDDMRGGLGSAVRVFGSDAIGSAYRDLVFLGPQMPAPIASSTLPLVVASATFDRDDPVLPRTGNELLFARYSWSDEFAATSGQVYRVDVYRFERWYMTVAGNGPGAGRPDGLNLSRWTSEPLVDGSQVDRITAPADRTDVLRHLHDATAGTDGETRDPALLVWMVGDDPTVAGTFRSIDASGSLRSTPPGGRASSTRWLMYPSIRFCDPDILDFRHHSVATNFSPVVMGVGRFAPRDIATGFPHGFEIQVVGPAAARQLLIHMTLVSTIGGGRRPYHDLQVIVDVRDL